MRFRLLVALVLLCCSTALPRSAEAGPAEIIQTPGLGQVWIYSPGNGAPHEVVLFISGDGGWNLGVVPMAEKLRDQGALVIGLDVRRLIKILDASGKCAYPAGVLEELSRNIQLQRRLPEYIPPILVGYSSGATLVYAALAAAPPETFAGGISLGFCADLAITRPLCQQRGLTAVRGSRGIGYNLLPNRLMRTPWMILQGEVDQVCAPAATRAFAAAVPGAKVFSLPSVGHGFAVTARWESQYLDAFHALASERRAAARNTLAPAVSDLPLTEVPATPSGPADTMAVILTGDGGWADLDKSVAQGLAAHGIPSVGLSSLRYYWTPRTPDAAAADLARIVRHYLAKWNARRVVLIGYSFGADVLPFLVNRLPGNLLARICAITLLGPSDSAEFEFHLSDWLRRPRSASFPTVPEVERVRASVLCVRGNDESDSVCRDLRGPHVTSVVLGGGHHFGGDYARVVDAILEHVNMPRQAAVNPTAASRQRIARAARASAYGAHTSEAVVHLTDARLQETAGNWLRTARYTGGMRIAAPRGV